MRNKITHLVLAALLIPLTSIAASEQKTPYDKVTQGNSTAVDKDYVFNIGAGAANPRLRGKASTNKVQFSHNGVDFKDIGSGSGAGGGGIVLNANGGFEEGLGEWTASGGTFTLETTAANVGFGTQAGAWNASAASQTLSNTAVTVPAGLQGKECSLSWYYKGGDANLKAQVFDGTNVIAESAAFTTQAGYSAKQIMYFTCPASGTMRARFIASADAALVYIDSVELGQASTLVFEDADFSEVILTTGNGHGSTNNKIRRFSVIEKNSGTAFTIVQSATDGDHILINEPGIYSVTYIDKHTSSVDFFGVSINSNQLTTSIDLITASHRKCYTLTTNNEVNTTSCTFTAVAGDIIRGHTAGTMSNTTDRVKFAIVKVK